MRRSSDRQAKGIKSLRGAGSVVAKLIAQANRTAEAGQWADAERLYLELTRLQPGEASAFHNLGVCQFQQGRIQEAARAHWNAAVRAPERTDFWLAFGELFRRLRFSAFDPSTQDMAISCLTHPGLSPAPYRKVAMSLVRCSPVLGPLLDSDVPVGDAELESLANEPLFLALLGNVVAPDMAFEGLVDRVRRSLLDVLPVTDVGEALLELAAAVALQAHLTAHVVAPGAEDAVAVRELASQAVDLFEALDQQSEAPQAALALAVLAAFQPLDSVEGLPGAEWEPGRHVPPVISDMWARTVVEPALSRALGAAVPQLSGPEPGVSSAVADQYESHPYPRWLRVDDVAPAAASDILPAIVPGLQGADERTLALLSGLVAPKILIAGCGTGCHALGAALRFEHSEVVALDLSRASLGYAATGALKYQQERIRFLQADILSLADWSERFDIIEAGGVLHHLADPIGGWRTLLGLLQPRGLMKVSLYSRLGRRAQAEARDALAAGGFGDSPEAIREARHWLADHVDPDTYRTLTEWRDFYSLDECRDLLFHSHEQAYDLEGIGEMLEELGLEFLGLEGVEPGAMQLFLEEQGPSRLVELGAWQEFELGHSSTFAGMYHFWVRETTER